MKRFLILLWAVASPLFAAPLATPAPATPPSPPLLNRTLPDARWTVTSKFEAKDTSLASWKGQGTRRKAAPARITVTKVVKDPISVLEERTNEEGVKTRTRYVTGHWMSSTQGDQWTSIPARVRSFDAPDYAIEDFAGFDWISPTNFAGTRDFEKHHCFVFKDRVVTLSQSEIDAIRSNSARDFSNVEASETGTGEFGKQLPMADNKADVTAYIDRDSRQPVALVIETPGGKTTRTYRFEKEAGKAKGDHK